MTKIQMLSSELFSVFKHVISAGRLNLSCYQKLFLTNGFQKKILFSMFSDEIQLNVSTQTNSNSFSFLLCFEVLSFLSRHAHAKWFVYAGM